MKKRHESKVDSPGEELFLAQATDHLRLTWKAKAQKLRSTDKNKICSTASSAQACYIKCYLRGLNSCDGKPGEQTVPACPHRFLCTFVQRQQQNVPRKSCANLTVTATVRRAVYVISTARLTTLLLHSTAAHNRRLSSTRHWPTNTWIFEFLLVSKSSSWSVYRSLGLSSSHLSTANVSNMFHYANCHYTWTVVNGLPRADPRLG
jgi:hypothetical protein